MSPGEIAELYRKRWQVEGFFRWLKCLLPCRHFFAESERGVTFQIYLALIAALLLAAELGRRPSKRMMELLRFHQMGWAEDGEVERGLERDLRAAHQAAARKNKA
jgi:IS4 transposase